VYRRSAARFFFFLPIDGKVMGLYWREERENIRGYIRRKILSALFSNNKNFTPYL